MNEQNSERYEFLCALISTPEMTKTAEAKWSKAEILSLLENIYLVTRGEPLEN